MRNHKLYTPPQQSGFGINQVLIVVERLAIDLLAALVTAVAVFAAVYSLISWLSPVIEVAQ